MNENIENVYDVIGRITSTLLEEHDPLALAAVMMVMGMRIYKTVLEEDEYQKIVDEVTNKKDRVHPLDTHGPLQ